MMRKRRYVLKTRAKLMLILLGIGYFAFKFVSQELIMDDQSQRIASLKQEIAAVSDQNLEIQKQIDYTKSDEYIEKMARERLGWVREGEIILIPKN